SRGVALVLHERVRARMRHRHTRARSAAIEYDLDAAATLEHRPHRARGILAAVRAHALLAVRLQARAWRVLRAQRSERLDGDREQFADRDLGRLVCAFAVVVVNEARTAVEEVARGPTLVFVVAPHLEVGVD